MSGLQGKSFQVREALCENGESLGAICPNTLEILEEVWTDVPTQLLGPLPPHLRENAVTDRSLRKNTPCSPWKPGFLGRS